MKSTITDHTYSSNIDTSDAEYLSLLHNAICLWSTYMQFVKKFGKKIVDYKDIGMNPKVLLLSAATSSSTTAVNTDNVDSTESSLHRVAQAWGFDILDIPGDGNCFFTSMAFQLHQLMTDSSQDLSPIVRRHFESIGLYGTQSVPELAIILRRLVVDEWTGVNRNDYQEFLADSDVGTEARSFLRDGHFSSALGDAMPLAMANVLHVPILILVPNALVPFLSIFPRFNIGPISSIFLCYNNEGPGHYDALIQRKLTQNIAATETYNPDKETKTQSQCGRDKDKSENVFCRCGINCKKQDIHSVKNLKQRAYNLKNRCKCVLKHAKCSTRCKCSGTCGGSNCKLGVQKLEKDSPCRRQSRKRGIHEIKTTPTKYMKLSQSKEEHLNILEYFIAVAIVNYFISNGLSNKILMMISTYNKIIGIIVSEETLKYLPVANHSENNIKNAINQICKKKKEHD